MDRQQEGIPQTGAPPLEDPLAPSARSAVSVTTGRMMTEEQMQRVSRHFLRNLLTICIIFPLFCLIQTLVGIEESYLSAASFAEFGLLAVFLSIAAIGSIAASVVLYSERRKQQQIQYACLTQGGNAECVMELYPDRLFCRSEKQAINLPFQRVTAFLEYQDMLVVAIKGVYVLFRAQDMTPADGLFVRNFLFSHLPSRGYRRYQPFQPLREEALPVSPLDEIEKPWLYTSVPVRETARITDYLRVTFPRALLLFLPIAMILGASLFCRMRLSAQTFNRLYQHGLFIQDVFLTAALTLLGCLAFGVLTLLFCYHLQSPHPYLFFGGTREVSFAFTATGLRLSFREVTLFVPQFLIVCMCERNGMTMKTPYGRFFIPFSAVPDPQVLRAICIG